MDVEQCSDAETESSVQSNKSSSANSKSPRSSPQVMTKKHKASKEGKIMRSKANCEELRYVDCVLETKDLWDKFHDLETEMIITKTGR